MIITTLLFIISLSAVIFLSFKIHNVPEHKTKKIGFWMMIFAIAALVLIICLSVQLFDKFYIDVIKLWQS